jgi:hypothetical protein
MCYYVHPVTARFKGRTVLDSPLTGIIISNLTRGKSGSGFRLVRSPEERQLKLPRPSICLSVHLSVGTK